MTRQATTTRSRGAQDNPPLNHAKPGKNVARTAISARRREQRP